MPVADGRMEGIKFIGPLSALPGVQKHIKRLSFITHFKIEFLLPLTGCRKNLVKMPELKLGFIQFSSPSVLLIQTDF